MLLPPRLEDPPEPLEEAPDDLDPPELLPTLLLLDELERVVLRLLFEVAFLFLD